MSPRTLGIIGIRLIGLLAIVQAFQAVPTVVALGLSFAQTEIVGDRSMQTMGYLSSAVLLLAWVAIGISLIAYARPIGERLFPDSEVQATPFGAEELQVVLFSTLGAFVLVYAVPEALRSTVALRIAASEGLEPAGGGLWGENGLYLGMELLRVVLGLYLLLGGRGIVTSVARLRRLGTDKGASDND